ncbi:MerR family transcriptional regulator [Bdellovibrio sp. HCB337]|uniref:MerR family transcriptional regulator n=1 Tax=Bdellovibrio sp. HCB337 TaxID=3394358 RepID=UPI0039A73C7B
MNIKQFASKTGLTPRAIRFYEEKGILKSDRNSGNQYRTFNQSHIQVATKISQFRHLGFSIDEIATMLKASPALSIESVQKNIKANLKKLYKEKEATEKRIQQTEALLEASQEGEGLSSAQKNLFKSMAYSDLREWSLKYLNEGLKQKSNGPVEQLQMVACAYADLIVKHNMGGLKHADYAESHRLIAKALGRAKEPKLAKRHEELAEAYDNLERDPAYYDLPV